MKTLLTLAWTTLAIASCTSSHPYKGSYLSKRGEMIEIESNGFMYWSPMSKNRDRFQLVGALSSPQIKGDADIAGPSSTPLLGTKAVLQWGGSVLQVDWNDFRPEGTIKRATQYRRREQVAAPQSQPCSSLE